MIERADYEWNRDFSLVVCFYHCSDRRMRQLYEGASVFETFDLMCAKHSFNDKPATIVGNTIKIWYKHGEEHRTTGPCYVNKESGISEYRIHGFPITKEEFEALTKPRTAQDDCI